MKRIILLFVFLSIFSVSDAQKFLRYHMNNNTYNGFYTENIESIIHDYRNGVATAIVQTSIKNHDIYIDNIDSIAIEDVNLTNGNINQYRIYEFNYNEGDIRKIYVDNRASLFASHNGDFGANDTILFSSAYNDIAWLFYTDSQGRIKKFFDGNRLLFFDYDSNNDLTILDLSTSISKNYSINNANGAKMVRALSIPSFFRNLANNAGFRDFLVGVGLNTANTIASNFAQAINDVGNNPELHNQNFFVDGLSIAGDLVGIGASLLAEAPSLGWSTAGIIVSTGFLMNDLNNLFNHIWPDSEQMNRYKEYYRNKYGITVKTINPENVKSNKADLRGTLMSFNGLNGNLYFTISKLASTEIGDRIAGFPDALTSNSYMVKGSATNLNPGSNYFYMLWYECDIDGLHFTFPSDNGMEFTTLGQVDFDDLFVGMNCLKSLYDSTNGDCWTDNTGWFTDNNVRNWHGIEIDSTCLSYNNKSIIKLQLPNNNLSGRLNLYECKGISEMDLSGNPISHFNITPLSSNGEGHGYHDLQALNMPGNGENVYLNASCCRNLRISAENNEIGTFQLSGINRYGGDSITFSNNEKDKVNIGTFNIIDSSANSTLYIKGKPNISGYCLIDFEPLDEPEYPRGGVDLEFGNVNKLTLKKCRDPKIQADKIGILDVTFGVYTFMYIKNTKIDTLIFQGKYSIQDGLLMLDMRNTECDKIVFYRNWPKHVISDRSHTIELIDAYFDWTFWRCNEASDAATFYIDENQENIYIVKNGKYWKSIGKEIDGFSFEGTLKELKKYLQTLDQSLEK